MEVVREFHYRLRARIGGHRPGSHPGLTLGAGQEYAAHGRLLDSPDPRRIDIHASVRSLRREWLVRHYRQRAAVPVHAIVDVSASMRFGAPRSKLEVAAEFVESLGYSAFRAGDSAGLLAFDTEERPDLHVPARHGRGMGFAMGEMLRRPARADRVTRRTRAVHAGAALRDAAARLAGRTGLVFVLSDFHWPLAALPATLDLLTRGQVIPVVIWDPREVEPPSRDGLLTVSDAESGAKRAIWMRARIRKAWRERVAQRRTELDALFAAQGMRPLRLCGAFDPDAVTRYFLEESS
jgi:uncharacterized protein (DUF58 family)